MIGIHIHTFSCAAYSKVHVTTRRPFSKTGRAGLVRWRCFAAWGTLLIGALRRRRPTRRSLVSASMGIEPGHVASEHCAPPQGHLAATCLIQATMRGRSPTPHLSPLPPKFDVASHRLHKRPCRFLCGRRRKPGGASQAHRCSPQAFALGELASPPEHPSRGTPYASRTPRLQSRCDHYFSPFLKFHPISGNWQSCRNRPFIPRTVAGASWKHRAGSRKTQACWPLA